MDFLRRRSRAEFVVVAAGVALLVLGFVVWNGVLNDSGDADEPQDALAMANATLTALEILPDPTPTATTPPAPTLAPSPTLLPVSAGGVCPADQPASDIPAVVPRGDPSHNVWFGKDAAGLWAAPADWVALLPEGTPDAESMWFAGGTTWVMWYGSTGPVELTGVQKDGDAVLGPIRPTSSSNQIQWMEFTIPAPGCWELTATSDDDKALTLTVEVLPVEQRPDVIFARALNDARPYEVPSTCPAAPWVGPEPRRDEYMAHYWIDAGDISANVPGWFVANEEQVLAVYAEHAHDEFSATAGRLNGATGEVIEATTSIISVDGRIVRYTFPSAGCWELEIAMPTRTATFVVYVYPEECAPAFEDGQIIAACEPPRE